MSFAVASRVADAVLMEGYALYPYRATSAKNRYRWTFGVLAPRVWSEAGGCEPWWLRAEVPIEGRGGTATGRLRFLRVVERIVEARDGEAFRPVERLDVGARIAVPWEEGERVEIDFALPISGALSTSIAVPPLEEEEVLRDEGGAVVGRVVRRAVELVGEVEARRDALSGPFERISVRVENRSAIAGDPKEVPRATAVRAAFVSTHVLLASGDGARFLSVVAPPGDAVALAARCASVGVHPVLAGARGDEEGASDVVLASPIILADFPAIAPESPGDFFDSSEIDALLALRTRTLTPEESALARATDPRVAELLDRACALDEAALARLHGVVRRSAGPRVPLLGGRLGPGARVRLRPNAQRRTDVQDLLFEGRTATVEAVREDVDGRTYLAVTIDDDPAVEMHRAKGRFHYYAFDEVEPL